jgi:hypothetical protein
VEQTVGLSRYYGNHEEDRMPNVTTDTTFTMLTVARIAVSGQSPAVSDRDDIFSSEAMITGWVL